MGEQHELAYSSATYVPSPMSNLPTPGEIDLARRIMEKQPSFPDWKGAMAFYEPGSSLFTLPKDKEEASPVAIAQENGWQEFYKNKSGTIYLRPPGAVPFRDAVKQWAHQIKRRK